MTRRSLPELVVSTSGEIADNAREYVRAQVTRALVRLPYVLSVIRVRLTRPQRTLSQYPALAQLNVTVDGRPVRVQLAASFFPEAGRLLRARLREQIERLSAPGLPRTWPAERPRLSPVTVPDAQRTISRHKVCPLATATPAEAALTMDVMDYDVHLFVDAETGHDSVIRRVGPTGYRLTRLSGMHPPVDTCGLPLTVDVQPVRTLSADEALGRLVATELPVMFFQDAATSRGSVLYQRYDGHYGLISPA